ncbi:IPTL-CTERM sorting domain-containing protein [Acidovorax sp. sif1233]|uniref:IPTL-CTERM sorting domain-containing protein n=1 Tax=Acidovorax sp. sif1233 TaxID=2854792 RepID=UPI001C4553D4|nr:IPTL-CTERM sorting domain-containing protein [Acidovorax sp. sif1233]MBV7455143.1 IPTL-CTERM sorting domain-containing protein [Acidovorax sp. sif1233]
MKQTILPTLLAACLALPAVGLAQTCASPNATSDYIVGQAEGRASAMHWETGLVWSRAIEGSTLADQQKPWTDWINNWLPTPFAGQEDWGVNAALAQDRLHTGVWRLPYKLENSALAAGCPDPDFRLNREVLPTVHGQGGLHGSLWTASPRPGNQGSAWQTLFDQQPQVGTWLSTNSGGETRLVRGGQPFANLPASPPADTVPAGMVVIYNITTPLASQSGAGASWGGVRISGNGRLRVNGAGSWVREAIVTSGDQIRVRLPAPATAGQQATATLSLRSGDTTGTAAAAANGGDEATQVRESSMLFTLHASAAPAPRACRVTPSGSGDGTSWPQAASLDFALAEPSCSEVWLKQSAGTPYVPSGAQGFVIERNVKLYGGFIGTEAALAERPQSVSPGLTVLDANNNSRVLYLDGSLGIPLDDTLIDSVYLLQGAAAGPGANGGALYCNGAGVGSVCSPWINRVHIGASYADGDGGALFNDASGGGVSSPVLTNVLISNNHAEGHGGAIYNRGEGGTSSPVLRNVSMEGNDAYNGSGGAMYNLAKGSGGVSSPVIEQASFTGNGAGVSGGAIHSLTEGGGTSHMQVRNATFAINQSSAGRPGGAIAIVGVDGDARVDAVHATFMGNMAGGNGNALFTQGGVVGVRNSVLWGSAATRSQAVTFFTGSTTITDSLIQDGCAGGNVAPMGGTATCNGVTLDADPELGAFGANGMDGFPSLYGYLPDLTSLLQDAVACTLPIDQRGIARPQGMGATPCDIGALERRTHVELAVTVTGMGVVNGAPSACATGTCSYNYPGEGTPQLLTLAAMPAMGHTFIGWSGACSGTGTCSITMDQARAVSAEFSGPIAHTLGGTVAGLTGIGLVLRNGGEDLSVQANGGFTFLQPVADGGSYAVTVKTPPTGQTCTVTGGSGTATANVISVQVACAAATYAVTALPAGAMACTSNAVAYLGTVTCHATPPAGQITQSISGCNGTPTGVGDNDYTTAPVTSACTITATFAPLPQQTHTLGGTATGLTGSGLVLRNGNEDLAVQANGGFTFLQPVADGGSYAVTVQAQPTGQRCTIANASGSNVAANVGNVQVACAPYFEGTTVPASGPGGTGSATFTGGGPACRFNLGATRFEAAPAALPPGHTLPQGLLRIKLVGCTTAVAMQVTWPEPVAGYTKYGLAARTDTQPSYFEPAGLVISGHTARFTLTDGAQGDDDWTPNGEIADPSGPMALAAEAIPTLSAWGLLLLSVLLGLMVLHTRRLS